MLHILVTIILIIIVMFVIFNKCDNFSNIKKFKAPGSFTKLKAVKTNVVRTIDDKGKNLLEKYNKQLYSIANIIVKAEDNLNLIQLPSFFNCNEKWPGCLPRPLYQGSCGSCWGFETIGTNQSNIPHPSDSTAELVGEQRLESSR